MHSETELAVAVRAAMRKKNLSEDQLAVKLNRSPGVIEKLLCGKVVPSKHLEQQLIETLGISGQRMKKMAERRERKTAETTGPAIRTVSAKKSKPRTKTTEPA